MSIKKKKSPWLILLVIVLGIISGWMTGTTTEIFGITFYSIYDFIGKLFINALMLIVVPLVSSSIITGVARIGNDSSFGRLGFRMFSFYLGTSLLAILIGLAMVNLFNPGAFFSTSGQTFMTLENTSQLQATLASEGKVDVTHILLQIIPSNIVEVFHGNMLGLIFFSLVFGFSVSRIDKIYSTAILNVCQGVFQTMLVMTELIMYFLPIGVFCLVAKSFTNVRLESFHSLGLFVITVISGLALFALVGLPLLLKCVGRVSPLRHFKAMAPALITVFSTSSSSATLPVTMECVEKRAGVSNRICSLVIPLGTSINMSGSALYECVAVMFLAQVYGIDISFMTQLSIVVLSLIVSMGIAGIPSASIVAIVVILKALGLPAEGIGLLFAVDRILDMSRATVNVFSDSCCAVLVARMEGEKDVLQKDTFD